VELIVDPIKPARYVNGNEIDIVEIGMDVALTGTTIDATNPPKYACITAEPGDIPVTVLTETEAIEEFVELNVVKLVADIELPSVKVTVEAKVPC
jgi:hypothetical protein